MVRTGPNQAAGKGPLRPARSLEHAPEGLESYLKIHGRDSLFEREAGKESGGWCFFMHGRQERTGWILRSETYECDLVTEEGSTEKIHKVRVKFACPASVREEVKRQMGLNEAVQKKGEGPHFLPRYRHAVPDRTLHELRENREVLFFTLLEGEILRGLVTGFSTYEISLSMKGQVPVVLLRHALFDVRDKRGMSYLKKTPEKTTQGAGT